MSIRSIGYSIGKKQAAHPWFFVGLAVLITLATLPGIPLLLQNVEPSLEKVLPQDIPEVKTMNDMRSAYGADMLYIVVTPTGTNTDVYAPENVRYLDMLASRLRSVDNIKEVRSFADVTRDEKGNIPLEKHAIEQAAARDPRTAQYVSQDRSVTVVMIRADTGASATTVARVVGDIKDALFSLEPVNPGVATQVTGFGAIDHATFQVIISDFTRITGVSFALMILFLLIYYRFSIKKTVYSILIMMLSLIWALGVTGYLGIQLNVVTMVAAAMIMALGSSYGINSVYHFYDDFLVQYPRDEAIAKFQEFLIIGLSGSAFAEIAGFLALLFGIMPSMRSLGIILAIGILFALLVSVLILPAFFFLLEKEQPQKRKTTVKL